MSIHDLRVLVEKQIPVSFIAAIFVFVVLYVVSSLKKD